MKNKQALYNKIMESVAKEVKKTLNEGSFTNWREKNVKKFDFANCGYCMDKILEVLNKLDDEHEIATWVIAYYDHEGQYHNICQERYDSKILIDAIKDKLNLEEDSDNMDLVPNVFFNIKTKNKGAFN